MSNQNRFLLPHQPNSAAASASGGASSTLTNNKLASTQANNPTTTATSAPAPYDGGQENEYEVDTDFDSYWEEEARNPNRNRIRIGRQYQATVPPLLKQGERDQRKLEFLETLSFCPKRSAKVTNAELDHYFTVAKSLNLFASLVETRSLLGRDVTIADLNRIRHKEGLSLASVIQPPSRQHASTSSNPTLVSPQQPLPPALHTTAHTACSPQKSPSSSLQVGDNEAVVSPTDAPGNTTTGTSSAASNQLATSTSEQQQQLDEQAPLNQPLMKALSHFISLHHPCHHDPDCKKLQKDFPLEDDSMSSVNLRISSSLSSPSKRSRSKQQQIKIEEAHDESQQQDSSDTGTQAVVPAQLHEDWTREEVELFSKAIEVCGKNFGSIKKEFLPSKSVRSIVEYYYIGSRETSESKSSKKSNQTAVDANEGCSSPEKSYQANNNGGGNGGNGGHDSFLPPSHKSNLPDQQQTQQQQQQQHYTDTTGNDRTGSGNNDSSTSKSNLSDASDMLISQQQASTPTNRNTSKQSKSASSINKPKLQNKNFDARMSVYNFDDEIKDDNANITSPPPQQLDSCLRPGAEVRPLKAKPILPNASTDGEASNSNVGSLKFFMDGQLVLKLNACQEQQEGGDKCHWVQSGDKLPAPSRQKRYNKRVTSDQQQLSLNGSQSNSVVSSQHDDDSIKTHDDLTDGEDSKESANSFTNHQQSQHHVATPRQKSYSASPTPKRLRQNVKPENSASNCVSPQLSPQGQSMLPIDYNRLAVNNRIIKENAAAAAVAAAANMGNSSNNNPNLNNSILSPQPQLINPAVNLAAAAMPNWLQANSFAIAAALLGGTMGSPFGPGAASGLLHPGQLQHQNTHVPINNNNNVVNLATSKPMDLSVEAHQVNPPKPIQTTAKSSRSRSKQKNN